jgi:hypothetical protein
MRSSIIVRTSYPPMWGVYDYDIDARCWGFPHRQDAIDFARELAATRGTTVVEIYSRHGQLESREEFHRADADARPQACTVDDN